MLHGDELLQIFQAVHVLDLVDEFDAGRRGGRERSAVQAQRDRWPMGMPRAPSIKPPSLPRLASTLAPRGVDRAEPRVKGRVPAELCHQLLL